MTKNLIYKEVLIVAKCNVNAFIQTSPQVIGSVLIVAKCNVNVKLVAGYGADIGGINSSKV